MAPRVLSFNEINLDFFLHNDNVYHFSRKNLLPAYKFLGKETPAVKRLIDEFSHRLFTVCSALLEYPTVQYQGSSPLCKAIAAKLNEVLSAFYQQQAQVKVRKPNGTILLLDRTFDLLSPAIHDYSYQSMVHEFFPVGDEGEITLGSKLAFLNDQDDLWVRFRNKHIAAVHATLN